MNQPFQAWVLRASVGGFIAGCKLLPPDTPRFGNLMKVQQADLCLFGLLTDVQVRDDLAARQLILVGNLEREVVLDQRENRLVPLEISVVTVGYRSGGGRVMYGLAPQPPLSLDALTVADAAELRAFTHRLDYLPLLLETRGVSVDELLLAHLSQAAAARAPDARYDFLVGAGRELARLLHHDLRRLETLLRRLRAAIN
ncbi:MAG: hypothetical protein Kow0031_29810 [Anaerolineae bacterium]